jgi:hypothetical protein
MQQRSPPSTTTNPPPIDSYRNLKLSGQHSGRRAARREGQRAPGKSKGRFRYASKRNHPLEAFCPRRRRVIQADQGIPGNSSPMFWDVRKLFHHYKYFEITGCTKKIYPVRTECYFVLGFPSGELGSMIHKAL